jgi:hypothetical protein
MLTTETWEMVRMTTPEQPQYSRKHCLLALYAALDKHVLDNPDQAAAVGQYLPGTTGLGQRGWSQQIEALIARLSRDPSTATFPDILTALNVLTTPREGADNSDEPLFTRGQQARFLYITAVLTQLGLPDTSRSTTTLLNRALSLAASDDQAPKATVGAKLRRTFTSYFGSYDEYGSALEKADPRLVSDVLKRLGPPCAGAVGQSGPESCVVLRSVIESDPGAVTPFDDVKNAANPINWPNHNKFFCQMDPLQPSQGWSRVLEHISTNCDQFHLKTAIKYWKGETPDGAAYVNYELDDNRTETADNLLVVVDSGTVFVSNTPKGTVQVESTKHVKITGFSVTATAMWACVNGWNEYGELMFFGAAQDAPWGESPDGGGAPTPPTPGTGTGTSVPVPTLPAGVRQEFVEESVAMMTNYLKDATETTSKYASRWLAGELQPDDFIRYYGEMSARWASEPWRFLARVMGSAGVTPPPTPAPNQQGGGTP